MVKLLLVDRLLGSFGDDTACTDVIEPFFVEVILSCKAPISVASVG